MPLFFQYINPTTLLLPEMKGYLLLSNEDPIPRFLVDQRPYPILKFTGTEASEVTVHKTLQKVDSSTEEAVKKYEVLLYKAEQLYRKELAAWREKC